MLGEGEGKCKFPKIHSVFPDRAFIPSCLQTASRSPQGLNVGGCLKIASDLADVAGGEGARLQPRVWHYGSLLVWHNSSRFMWTVHGVLCGPWVRRIRLFWLQASEIWLSQAELITQSLCAVNREQHAPPENSSQIH